MTLSSARPLPPEMMAPAWPLVWELYQRQQINRNFGIHSTTGWCSHLDIESAHSKRSTTMTYACNERHDRLWVFPRFVMLHNAISTDIRGRSKTYLFKVGCCVLLHRPLSRPYQLLAVRLSLLTHRRFRQSLSSLSLLRLRGRT